MHDVHLEELVASYSAERDRGSSLRFGVDTGVASKCFLAMAVWPLGDFDATRRISEDAIALAQQLYHVPTLAYAHSMIAALDATRRDSSAARSHAEDALHLGREHGMPLYQAMGSFFRGWATAASGAVGCGLEDMRRGAKLLREQNVLNFDGLLKIALAEAEARAGDGGRAVAILDEALATCGRTGYRAFEAELHRARGEILLQRDPANPAPAEEALLTAIAVSKQQGTRSFELRAALSLAKLYQSTARPADAHAVLAPALDGFSPTPQMPELAEAQALLMTLNRSSIGQAH